MIVYCVHLNLGKPCKRRVYNDGSVFFILFYIWNTEVKKDIIKVILQSATEILKDLEFTNSALRTES